MLAVNRQWGYYNDCGNGEVFLPIFYSIAILVNFALYFTTEIVIPAPKEQF